MSIEFVKVKVKADSLLPQGLCSPQNSSGQNTGVDSVSLLQAQLLKNPLAGDPSSIPGSGKSPGEGIGYPLQYSWASLVAQLVKNPPAMWETWLPTPVFWPKEFHGLYGPWGRKELDMAERRSLPFSRGFSQPRDGTQIFHIAGGFFTS